MALVARDLKNHPVPNPCLWWGVWNEMIFEVPPNPKSLGNSKDATLVFGATVKLIISLYCGDLYSDFYALIFNLIYLMSTSLTVHLSTGTVQGPAVSIASSHQSWYLKFRQLEEDRLSFLSHAPWRLFILIPLDIVPQSVMNSAWEVNILLSCW